MKLNILNWGMRMHLSMAKEHSATYSGSIDCEGHIMHGKTLCQSYVHKKPFSNKENYSHKFYIAEQP